MCATHVDLIALILVTRNSGNVVGWLLIEINQYLQVSVLLQDILHMLVGVNAVVICKFNPVLDYLGPFAECVPSTPPNSS